MVGQRTHLTIDIRNDFTHYTIDISHASFIPSNLVYTLTQNSVNTCVIYLGIFFIDEYYTLPFTSMRTQKLMCPY